MNQVAQTTPPTLTAKQLQVLRLIRDFRQANGYSPSLRELASSIGISQVTVKGHVDALVRKGVLLRDSRRSRAITPTGEDKRCPLCNQLTGEPS